MAPAKAIFGELEHEVVSTITRDNEQPESEKALGRFHNAEMAKAKVQDSQRARKMRKLQVRAATAGIEFAGTVRDPDDALQAIERREHFLQALLKEEQQGGNQHQEPKV